MDDKEREDKYYSFYFHSDSNTLRNFHEDIIAYLNENYWVLCLEQIEAYYNQDILNEFVLLFENKITLDPDDLIIRINRIIHNINSYKKKYETKIINAAIVLEVKNKEISSLQRKIIEILEKQKIKCEKIKHPHVSTAYLVGQESYSNINLIFKSISNFKLEFKSGKIKILNGTSSNRDYLVLELEPPENFKDFLKIIKKRLKIKEFSDGFKTHISLVSVERKLLNDQVLLLIEQELRNQNVFLNHEIKFKPQALSLYNQSYKVELTTKIKDD